MEGSPKKESLSDRGNHPENLEMDEERDKDRDGDRNRQRQRDRERKTQRRTHVNVAHTSINITDNESRTVDQTHT